MISHEKKNLKIIKCIFKFRKKNLKIKYKKKTTTNKHLIISLFGNDFLI